MDHCPLSNLRFKPFERLGTSYPHCLHISALRGATNGSHIIITHNDSLNWVEIYHIIHYWDLFMVSPKSSTCNTLCKGAIFTMLHVSCLVLLVYLQWCLLFLRKQHLLKRESWFSEVLQPQRKPLWKVQTTSQQFCKLYFVLNMVSI